jgi:hypothetical protein
VGHVIVRRRLKRRYVLAFFQKLSPCLVGIEACLVQEYLGHTNVRNTARYMDGVSARFRGIWD